MTEIRAVIFDMDDTLYASRDFVLSGFDAVAIRVEQDFGIPAPRVRRALRWAFMHGGRGRELQHAVARFGLPQSAVPLLLDVIRSHTPDIRLPLATTRVLRALRSSFRTGVLTNGLPPVQKLKVKALGLAELVDAVVYATECGDGRGKPAPDGFVAVLRALDVRAEEAVFVGDNPEADIAGAVSVGMRAIHLMPTLPIGASRPAVKCDALVTCLRDVAPVVARMAWLERRDRVA